MAKQPKQRKGGKNDGDRQSSSGFQPRDGMSAIAGIAHPSKQQIDRRNAALCRLQ